MNKYKLLVKGGDEILERTEREYAPTMVALRKLIEAAEKNIIKITHISLDKIES